MCTRKIVDIIESAAFLDLRRSAHLDATCNMMQKSGGYQLATSLRDDCEQWWMRECKEMEQLWPSALVPVFTNWLDELIWRNRMCTVTKNPVTRGFTLRNVVWSLIWGTVSVVNFSEIDFLKRYKTTESHWLSLSFLKDSFKVFVFGLTKLLQSILK